MDYTFRPIVTWPGPLTRQRKRAQFRSTYNDTLRLLDRELQYLQACQVVFQVALSEGDLRRDGRPRAGSNPVHPGVIVAFESRHGPLNYPCDTYDRWEDNLRAIALVLEHLRAVDRYGVTRRGEQYCGWSALPPPIITPAPMTRNQALALLGGLSGLVFRDREGLQQAYRAAVLKTHPDRGGAVEDFRRVQAAKELLEKELS